jgi:hypothetical protein
MLSTQILTPIITNNNTGDSRAERSWKILQTSKTPRRSITECPHDALYCICQSVCNKVASSIITLIHHRYAQHLPTLVHASHPPRLWRLKVTPVDRTREWDQNAPTTLQSPHPALEKPSTTDSRSWMCGHRFQWRNRMTVSHVYFPFCAGCTIPQS